MAMALFDATYLEIRFDARSALTEDVNGIVAVLISRWASVGIALSFRSATIKDVVIGTSCARAEDSLGFDFEGSASRTRKPFASSRLTAACVSIRVVALEASTVNILRTIFVKKALWALVGIAPLFCSATLCEIGVRAVFIVTKQALVMPMEGARRALK